MLYGRAIVSGLNILLSYTFNCDPLINTATYIKIHCVYSYQDCYCFLEFLEYPICCYQFEL